MHINKYNKITSINFNLYFEDIPLYIVRNNKKVKLVPKNKPRNLSN